jgi:hypothetical protein
LLSRTFGYNFESVPTSNQLCLTHITEWRMLDIQGLEVEATRLEKMGQTAAMD